jgi:antitoxin component HigA of HigAB toxin-antitoxin module
MEIRPIRTQADHAAALRRIDSLIDAETGTPEGDELDVLTMLVENFERRQFAVAAPDPVEFIKNVMEFRGLGQNDLATVLNSRSRASEILSRRRPLTLHQIRLITQAWQLPADSLIGEYEVAS